jgi:hypothetical protein
MDIDMDSIGDTVMDSGMDIIMECEQVIVQVTVRDALQHPAMCTGTGPAGSGQLV